MTADEAYDFDCGVTEVDYAVAETGSVVIRHRPEHGRLLSLVPFVHVAVVDPKQLVPDLIDLFLSSPVFGQVMAVLREDHGPRPRRAPRAATQAERSVPKLRFRWRTTTPSPRALDP